MYNLNKADWGHKLRRAGNLGKFVPFFSYLPLFNMHPTYRCPGRNVNKGFAQPGWLQGMTAFTRSALGAGSCYTVANIQTPQELWSRCAGPGFKDATLFLDVSLARGLNTSRYTPGLRLSLLPALLLSETGYSFPSLCLTLRSWLQCQARAWWSCYLCPSGWLLSGSNSGVVNPHCP